MQWWFLGAAAGGVVLLLLARLLARAIAFRRRVPVTPEELYDVLSTDGVSMEVVQDVWTRIGKAYRVDVRKIRPQDTLKMFRDLDSWLLSKGTEELEAWLGELGIRPGSAAPKTVRDLAVLVQARRG